MGGGGAAETSAALINDPWRSAGICFFETQHTGRPNKSRRVCCYYNTVPLLYYVRCLLQPEGAEAVATGLASYSLLELVLRLLRVGIWARSVLPLTLREAQGILFDLQVTPTLEAHRHTTGWHARVLIHPILCSLSERRS